MLYPLSCELSNQKFQNYISVSIAHVTESYIRSLVIAFKNDEWCHFVVRIGFLELIHFIACVSFLSVSLFFLIFLWSTLLAEVWK